MPQNLETNSCHQHWINNLHLYLTNQTNQLVIRIILHPKSIAQTCCIEPKNSNIRE